MSPALKVNRWEHWISLKKYGVVILKGNDGVLILFSLLEERSNSEIFLDFFLLREKLNFEIVFFEVQDSLLLGPKPVTKRWPTHFDWNGFSRISL